MSLSSVRVLDLSMGWAGPLVSFVLAELGAEVIKVEAIHHYDWWRGPHPRDAARAADGTLNAFAHEQSAVFNTVNRHKQGITLDLTTAEGRAAALDLVRVSDLLVENFSPHAMESLALDYPTLRTVNPELVMLSMPAFGASGPQRDYIGYGMTIEAMAGMTALTGYVDGPPQMLSNAYGDPISGLNGAVAALIALHDRARSGGGRHIEIAQVEGFIPMIAGALLDAQFNGRDGRRQGNRHPSMAPHGVVPCRDDTPKAERGPMIDEASLRHRSSIIDHPSTPWVAVAVGSDAQWAALCDVLGRPELVEDARFGDVVSRKHHEDDALAILAAWAAERTQAEVVAALREAGVDSAPVQNSADLLADVQHIARGFFTVVERQHVGAHLYPGLPFQFNQAPAVAPDPAPCLGEHSEVVLTRLLGMSEEQHALLRAAGITGTELPLNESAFPAAASAQSARQGDDVETHGQLREP